MVKRNPHNRIAYCFKYCCRNYERERFHDAEMLSRLTRLDNSFRSFLRLFLLLLRVDSALLCASFVLKP